MQPAGSLPAGSSFPTYEENCKQVGAGVVADQSSEIRIESIIEEALEVLESDDDHEDTDEEMTERVFADEKGEFVL